MSRLPSLRTWSIAPLLVLILGLAGAAEAQASVSVYRRILHSTGWIVVPSRDGVQAGTCFVVDDAQRLVLTCAHVVGQASEALVYFPQYRDGEAVVEARYYLNHVPALVGRVIAKDTIRDLALLRLETLPANVVALTLAAHSPEPGEVVHSIGNSALADGGMLWRYTRGYVRLVYPESISTDDHVRQVRVVETQSPVNKGDSGGPVVNAQCQLVGVTDSYAAHERLVSESTDITEVKAFLKKTLHQDTQLAVSERDSLAPSGASERASIIGDWKVTATGVNGHQMLGQGHLDRNETFTISFAGPGKHPRVKRGRYAYANGILWLMAGDTDLLAPLTWSNADQFTIQAEKGEITFERQLIDPGGSTNRR